MEPHIGHLGNTIFNHPLKFYIVFKLCISPISFTSSRFFWFLLGSIIHSMPASSYPHRIDLATAQISQWLTTEPAVEKLICLARDLCWCPDSPCSWPLSVLWFWNLEDFIRPILYALNIMHQGCCWQSSYAHSAIPNPSPDWALLAGFNHRCI